MKSESIRQMILRIEDLGAALVSASATILSVVTSLIRIFLPETFGFQVDVFELELG